MFTPTRVPVEITVPSRAAPAISIPTSTLLFGTASLTKIPRSGTPTGSSTWDVCICLPMLTTSEAPPVERHVVRE